MVGGEAEAAAVLAATGEGEVAGVAFDLRVRFSAGEGEAAASAAGEGEVAGIAFALRGRLLAGEGEAALVASAFLWARCFAGDGDAAGDPPGVGDLPCTRQMLARPITEMSVRNLVVISKSISHAEHQTAVTKLRL